MWVALGLPYDSSSNYASAYSYDGINWTGVTVATSNLSRYWYIPQTSIAWNGTLWIAVNRGWNSTIAYSIDGIRWVNLQTNTYNSSIFLNDDGQVGGLNCGGSGVAWNGTLFVAVGTPDQISPNAGSIGYSYNPTATNGSTWFAAPNSTNIFSTKGAAVTWNGNMFIAVGVS